MQFSIFVRFVPIFAYLGYMSSDFLTAASKKPRKTLQILEMSIIQPNIHTDLRRMTQFSMLCSIFPEEMTIWVDQSQPRDTCMWDGG